MSQKFGNHRKRLSIAIVAMSTGLVLLSSCDPCYQLAERMCECKPTDAEKRACINALGLASEHKYFKKAKSPNVCIEALKNCTCEKINDNEDEECAMYRPSDE